MAASALNIPTHHLADYVASLAEEHGVQYVRTSSDVLAEVITRLSDDEVVTDSTENLIVALKKANVVDGRTMVALLGNYLREKYNSRSV